MEKKERKNVVKNDSMNGVESPCPHYLSFCICHAAEESYATYHFRIVK
jgi:hypothetical protein